MVVVIVLDTLRRMIYGVRPFDILMLVVEVLVLLLIAYEVGVNVWRDRRRTRRSRKVLGQLTKGQKLQADAPVGSSVNNPSVVSWANTTTEWANETSALLSKYSEAASVSFLHVVGGANSSFGFGHINPYAQHAYILLQEQLNNLRSILENPDVYL
jgi:hypothetical protein